MATKITTAVAAAMANALRDAADAGSAAKIIIYGGTEPTTANDTASATVLATFTLSDPSFPTSTDGVLTLDVTPALTVAASASGTATHFRLLTSANVAILQGSVGTTGQQLNLNTIAITSAVNVTITSGTITVPQS